MQSIDIKEKLFDLFSPEVEALGYELIELELISAKPKILRMYIDNDAGIQVEDCAEVSRHVSVILDVEDPISGEYVLEVSSPGTERPLRLPEHYARYIGEQAKFKLMQLHEGRKRFKGKIESVQDETVSVLVDDKTYEVPFALIQKAHLSPEYEF